MQNRAKHQYRIVFNDGKNNKSPLTYKYGSIRDIRIHVGSQKAVIEFESGSNKTITDLTSFKMKLFRDAYRKLHLLHAIKYDTGLIVKRIEITIDDKTEVFDKQSPHFPFLFAMIGNTKLNLSNSWEHVVNPILETPKTKKDTDLRFCSVFSFLAAKTRAYQIDRFTNLWTAMNAYGNYLAKFYEMELAKEYDLENASNNAMGVLGLYGKDTKIVHVLGLMLKRSLKLHSVSESTDLWKDYYGIQNALLEVQESDYEEMYEEAWSAMMDESYVFPDKYKNLVECANHFEVPLFILLLTEYPYHLRCMYLHGSFSTILFSAYNDYEIASLGAVNYFLERFLNEKIPEMFMEGVWGKDRYHEIQECVCTTVGVDKHGKSIYENAIKKLSKI